MFSRWFVSRRDYDRLRSGYELYKTNAHILDRELCSYIKDVSYWKDKYVQVFKELDKYKRKRDAKGRFIKKENNHD